MGLIFKNFPGFTKFWVFLWQNCQKWVPFFRKIPKNGLTIFGKITHMNTGMGPKLPAASPDQSKSENPPLGKKIPDNIYINSKNLFPLN